MNSSDSRSARAAGWTALVGLMAAGVPGMCPACWPSYLGLLSSVGLGAIPSLFMSMPVFVAVVALGLVPLLLPAVQRREWDSVLAVITGAGLIIEARWLGGTMGLHTLGVVILVFAAITSSRRPACAAAPLTQIGRG